MQLFDLLLLISGKKSYMFILVGFDKFLVLVLIYENDLAGSMLTVDKKNFELTKPDVSMKYCYTRSAFLGMKYGDV